MVHRALLGSIERFFGVLIEHYGGAFPVWLAPDQATILTITDAHQPHALRLHERLKGSGLRVAADVRGEKLGLKIREAQLAKVPYMLIVGDKEVASDAVSVRTRKGEDLGAMPVDEFIRQAQEDIHAKR
jgi:threonyl-tRNA synthetase